MQLSAIPVPVVYTPVQPIAPVSPVKGRDPDADDGQNAPRARAAPPPGVGTLFDIQA